ncbi:unnamed protein product [Paramecium sonneborni]|uniref:Uncharacterized protein n=1 Tax=Paramecium sonneborni TaxID=65129 RepID=A0A8S1QZA0_9CILI|nr:unnamed protein product [Paramecium sonneborni]
MAKEVNREEYARKKHFNDKKKQFATEKLKASFPNSLEQYNKEQIQELKDCNCPKDQDSKKGINHTDVCLHEDFQAHQKQQKKLLKNYIYYKTEYNHDRGISPEFYFARQIYQKKQADLLKIQIKQKICKGKDFNDDFVY